MAVTTVFRAEIWSFKLLMMLWVLVIEAPQSTLTDMKTNNTQIVVKVHKKSQV